MVPSRWTEPAQDSPLLLLQDKVPAPAMGNLMKLLQPLITETTMTGLLNSDLSAFIVLFTMAR